MLAVQSQPPRVGTAEATADSIAQAGKVFHYLPTPGVGALPGQPSNWPTVWSTAAEFDLMSRLAQLPTYAPPSGLGDVTSDIAELIQKAPDLLQKGVQLINQAGPQLDTIIAIVQDPVFPQIVDKLKQLQSIEDAKSAASPSATSTTTPTPGSTGLNQLVPVLDAAIFTEQHPAAKFALDHPILVGAGAAVLMIGIGAGVGYGISRLRKCRVKATPAPAAAPAAMGRRRRRR